MSLLMPLSCPQCGIQFAVIETYIIDKGKSGKSFCCPNGDNIFAHLVKRESVPLQEKPIKKKPGGKIVKLFPNKQ